MGNSAGKIPCRAIVFRALLRSTDISDDVVSPNAYMPKPTGVDDDGLSVHVAKSEIDDLERLKAESHSFAFMFTKPKGAKGVASLHVGKVRDIILDGESSLDVIRDTQPDNEDHGLIIGIPSRTQEDNIIKIEKIAGRLARLSRMIYER